MFESELVIVEKYDQVVDYIYPKIQNIPRRHGQFRDKLLQLILAIPGQIYLAIKLRQISKLYIIDSSLAELRWMLRFSVNSKVRCITPHQYSHAMILLADVGKLLNGWISNMKHK